MEQPSLNLLGDNTKRLTSRRRGKRRGRKRKEVKPQIQPTNLANPIFGCPVDLLDPEKAQEDPDKLGVMVTRQEKELIVAQSRKQRKNLPTLVIEEISYSLFDHEELEKEAVFEATNTNDEGLYSVNDPRGGVVDRNSLCKTCYLDNMECPGHFGIIKLAEPIIHPSFRREVVDILTSICNSCGGLLLPIDQIKEKGFLALSGMKRLRAIADASSKLPCRRKRIEGEEGITACIANPTYKTSKLKETGKIFYTYDIKGKGIENVRSIEDIEAIFDSITKEEAEILGFSGGAHPRKLILKSITVMPLCARAPVIQDGLVLKDDTTSMYQDIIRYNEELKKDDLDEHERGNKLKNLIFSIEHLIDNSDKKYRQGKKKAYQSIKDRIQGKEAIIRSSMMGKRVNYSARTVLGPDPNLKFGQIRIPKAMAPYLTQHEVVTPANIKRLTALFNTGKITYITPSRGRLEGRRIKVNEKVRETYRLTFGDEVDRWLQNGDYVVFNRQPTLHKQGIMGYEVVLGTPKTIGLHLGYTPQHNAD